MALILDTNILVRAFADDDPVQTPVARSLLAEATAIVLTLPMLCELVWVLRRRYKRRASEVAQFLDELLGTAGVIVDRSAFNDGLRSLRAGGDFADGVIAHEGQRLGGETFVSFDREAVELVAAQGGAAKLLNGKA